MEGPFFRHHPQFHIGKLQEFPQGVRLGKIQILRSQYLPCSPVIFDEGILQAGNAALGQKGHGKQKMVTDVELRQDGIEDLSFLFLIIGQDFRHITLVGFDGIVDKAFAQALFKGSVFSHDVRLLSGQFLHDRHVGRGPVQGRQIFWRQPLGRDVFFSDKIGFIQPTVKGMEADGKSGYS